MSRPELSPLPIDALLDEAVERLGARRALVVEASPGAGKTTRIPRALLDRRPEGRIIVLEPRRLAARMAAQRVAAELGEEIGETVGYRVRFDSKVGRRTRLEFVTEGVLTRRLATDPSLSGVGTVIVDELHERHLQCDLALALLRRLQRTTRPDLEIVAMSATLDAAPVLSFLDAAHIRCDMSRFEVAVEHLPASREPLDRRVAGAVRKLVDEGLDGHLLVFLPGAAEIRRAQSRCEAVARDHDLAVRPLYGALSAGDQDAALAPCDRRKLILATNVAETSLTIDGVAAVIDSGLVKIAVQHPWTTLPRLKQRLICKASATQRAGRAGRTRDGRCLRLYGSHELDRQPDHETPEILRSDLCELLLTLHASGASDEVTWLTNPPPDALTAARRLLESIGALTPAAARITDLGRRLLGLPLHPRLGRVLLEACALGVGERACGPLAVLSEGSRGLGSTSLWERAKAPTGAATRARRQLLPICRRLPGGPLDGDEDEALMMALARGFPDRVAKRTARSDLQLADGGRAVMAGDVPPYCIVLDAEVGRPGEAARVRLAAPIDGDLLLLAFVDHIVDESTLAFDGDRVERLDRLRFRNLVLDETHRRAEPSAEASNLLLAAIEQRGGLVAILGDRLAAKLARARFAKIEIDPAKILRETCQGLVSLREVRDAGLDHAISAELDRQGLAERAPERIRMGGRELVVHYPEDAPPWIESYLQDFFGMDTGPRIGAEPLVLHLWGPNRRALQITSDLSRFWQVHYPALRRQLMRRYPKHHWPESPATAKPARLKRDL